MNLFTRTDARAEVLKGDCLEVLRTMEDESVEAVVTDPPAGISFMNAEWDSNKGSRNQWIAWLTEVMEEVLRVTKPGGHALVWALPRTSHWTAMALEDAGWEVRDRITHHFGSGFPKSTSISKQLDKMGPDQNGWRRFAKAYTEAVKKSEYNHNDIDKHLGIKSSSCYWVRTDHRGGLPPRHHWESVRDLLGLNGSFEKLYKEAEREVLGKHPTPATPRKGTFNASFGEALLTAPATDAAKLWDGWGTALKPSTEDWWLCRKPLSESSIARNVLEHNCGAINIDGCRVGGGHSYTQEQWTQKGASRPTGTTYGKHNGSDTPLPSGRFPANLLLSHIPGPNGCVRIGEKRVKGDGHWTHKREIGDGNIYGGGGYQDRDDGNKLADPDGKETVAAYECARDEAGNHICPVALMDEQSGDRPGSHKQTPTHSSNAAFGGGRYDNSSCYSDSGGASRFFAQFAGEQFTPDTGAGFKYVAKAAKRERNLGLADFLPRTKDPRKRYRQDVTGSFKARAKNRHSTVKPVELLRYLSRLICPPGGTILDPFCGSGTGGVAAVKEGFNFVGIEMETPSVVTARARIEHALYEAQPKEESPYEGLFSLEEVCNA